MKRKIFKYTPHNIQEFKNKILNWSNKFDFFTYLESNSDTQKTNCNYNTYDCLFAIGNLSVLKVVGNDSFDSLQRYINKCKDWIFGHINYDLKNEIENLSSNNEDLILFPNISFFQPKYLIIQKGVELSLYYNNVDDIRIFNEIDLFELEETVANDSLNLKPEFTKEDYLKRVAKVQNEIKKGNIYELNFCFKYGAQNVSINPSKIWQNLNELSNAPMSCYYKNKNHYLLCSSPERFIKKINNKLIAQPIKGTAKRGESNETDELIKIELKNNLKEQNENVMIVDLVRNDLSKVADSQSVKVEELFEVYSFKQVHQLISTITCSVSKNYSITNILNANFPMGSMTGAPKVSAMKLIEEFELTKRGIYSGTIGYIEPNGNFDFNVVIRSLIYNSENKNLSYSVGSAITSLANANEEYDECLLKAKIIQDLFKKLI